MGGLLHRAEDRQATVVDQEDLLLDEEVPGRGMVVVEVVEDTEIGTMSGTMTDGTSGEAAIRCRRHHRDEEARHDVLLVRDTRVGVAVLPCVARREEEKVVADVGGALRDRATAAGVGAAAEVEDDDELDEEDVERIDTSRHLLRKFSAPMNPHRGGSG